MSVNISEWTALVAPNAEGANSGDIEKQVLRTLREFCERTKLWKATLDAIDIVDGTAEYSLSYTGADIVEVYNATVDDDQITPVTELWLDANDPEWRESTSTSDYPEQYYVTPSKKIHLVYTPSLDITDGLVVYAVLKPKTTAGAVQDFLFNEHYQVITDGTAARMLRVSGNRHENIKMAEYFQQQFELGVARAKIRAVQGLSRASVRGKNYFF